MARRPFRALRSRPPKQRYDAVVVGAGIGGLFCANFLAREGLSVLLVEQHYMVGGYCSTFRRAGFTFDAATHFYPLLGNPNTLPGRLLERLGVECRWVRMDPVDTFHLPDGTSFRVPADLEAYLRAVTLRFPHQQSAIQAFFSEAREAYLLGLLAHFKERAAPRLARHQDLTLRDVLDRHFSDPKLKLLLCADAPHWGSPPGRTSFVFDSMLRLAYFQGNYYPVGGSQAFADALAARFEQMGGDILMSARVDRILVHGEGVSGITAQVVRGRLRGRWHIAAPVVASNADLRLTLEELVGEQHLGATELDRLRCLRRSHPCYLAHVGLGGVATDALEAVQGYYWRDWDPEAMASGALRCKIFVPTLYEPRLAPDGKHAVILQKVMAVEPEAVTDWAAHKREVEDHLVDHLERVLPGATQATEVLRIATARTCHRYTLNQGGAMLGWEMAPDQVGAARPGVEGPMRGLFFTGHWVRPGGGIVPVIVSAVHAAERITGATISP